MKGLTIVAVVSAFLSTMFVWGNWTWILPSTNGGDLAEQTQMMNAVDRPLLTDEVRKIQLSTWNSERNTADIFEVSLRDKQWLISSHYDYPADGGDRVGNTAGKVMNIRRGPLVSSDPILHPAFAVVSPVVSAGMPIYAGQAYGERVRICGPGDVVLVDIIIGNAVQETAVVDPRSFRRSRMHYVRASNSHDVYIASVDLDLSLTFKDWVETDLLKLDESDIRKIIIQDYSVNASTRRVEGRAETRIVRTDATAVWTPNSTPDGTIMSEVVLTAMLSEVADLHLSDIRPFSFDDMKEYGFFIDQNEQVLGNEGALKIVTENGIVYQLYFGEIVLNANEDTNSEQQRYMSVLVSYEERSDQFVQAIRSAQSQSQALAKSKIKESESKENGDDVIDDRNYIQELKDQNTKRSQQITQAQERFTQYFFIIDEERFKKLRPSQDLLFVPVGTPPAPTVSPDSKKP